MTKLTQRVSAALSPASPLALSLFAGCGPTAVVWAIALVVVYPVQSQSGRAFPHVRQELLKRVQPLGTDRNTPTPIIHISGMFRIKTSLFHIHPRDVSRAVSLPVLCSDLRRPLFLEAPTAFVFPIFKVTPAGDRNVAAEALTDPLGVSSIPENYQTREHLSGQIFKWWHSYNYTTEIVELS